MIARLNISKPGRLRRQVIWIFEPLCANVEIMMPYSTSVRTRAAQSITPGGFGLFEPISIQKPAILPDICPDWPIRCMVKSRYEVDARGTPEISVVMPRSRFAHLGNRENSRFQGAPIMKITIKKFLFLLLFVLSNVP